MRLRRSEPDWRLFKQLEFSFAPVVAAPHAIVGRAHRLPLSKTAGGAPALQFIRGRDSALESQARELLRSLGAGKLAREIRVEWNPRMKSAAGRADFREKLIWLNPLLLELSAQLDRTKTDADKLDCLKQSSLTSAGHVVSQQTEQHAIDHDEIDRTLRHELAHLLAQWRAGRRRIAPHGVEWRQACRDLGIADEARCHNLPFSKTYPPRYVYRCPNCKEKFPRVRRIRRAIACLACCRNHNRGGFDPRFRLKMEGHAPSCP
jgi:predicted SprT family Zn-dependent metalloprotease